MIELACSLVRSGRKHDVLVIASRIDSHATHRSDYSSVNTSEAAVAELVSPVDTPYEFLASASRRVRNPDSTCQDGSGSCGRPIVDPPLGPAVAMRNGCPNHPGPVRHPVRNPAPDLSVGNTWTTPSTYWPPSPSPGLP